MHAGNDVTFCGLGLCCVLINWLCLQGQPNWVCGSRHTGTMFQPATYLAFHTWYLWYQPVLLYLVKKVSRECDQLSGRICPQVSKPRDTFRLYIVQRMKPASYRTPNIIVHRSVYPFC